MAIDLYDSDLDEEDMEDDCVHCTANCNNCPKDKGNN
jgi:hypothetical protein